MIHILLSISSGLLLTLAFPKPDLAFLAWFALIPLMIIASQKKSLIKLLLLGLLSGLVHYTSLLYWIIQALCHLVHLPYTQSLTIFCLLSVYLSIYPAFFLIFCNRFCNSTISALFLIPAFWVVLEYVRTYLISGFPWGLLGYTQFKHTLIIQISDLFGVYGVSYLIILGNVAFFFLVMAASRKTWKGKKVTWTRALTTVLIYFCCFCLSVIYGQYCIDSWDQHIQARPSASFAIIQGNIDQSIKWDPKYTRTSEKKYLNLSITQQSNQPDLFVWPETALTFYFQKKSRQSKKIKHFIKIMKTDFLIGSPAYIRNNSDQYSFYNRAYLISKNGTISQSYDKYHLVPFGEYIPFQEALFFMKKFVEGENNFSSGNKLQPIQWKNYRIAVQICYEIIFPYICRTIVQNNAHIIINMTNDAWFGNTGAPYQHFAMAAFRAIENRRALIRSANTGISGLIDPLGRVLAKTPLFKDIAFTVDACLIEKKSLYTRYGNFFANFCMFSIYIAVFLRLSQHFNQRRTS